MSSSSLFVLEGMNEGSHCSWSYDAILQMEEKQIKLLMFYSFVAVGFFHHFVSRFVLFTVSSSSLCPYLLHSNVIAF